MVQNWIYLNVELVREYPRKFWILKRRMKWHAKTWKYSLKKGKFKKVIWNKFIVILYFYYNFLRKYLSCNIYMSFLCLIFILTSFYEKRSWDTVYIFWFKVRISHWGIMVDAIKFPQISFYDTRMDSILNRLIPTSIIKMCTISFLIPLKHLNLLGRPIANVPRYL